MSARRSTLSIALACLSVIAPLACAHSFRALAFGALAAPASRQPADAAGTWEITVDKGAEICRVQLRPQQSDKGDYFLGMTPACRHALPELARIGRWTMPDPTHLALSEPNGAAVLTLAAVGDAFAASQADHAYALRRIGEGDQATAGLTPPDDAPPSEGPIVPVAKRSRVTTDAPETRTDLAGRYAVMREKRDTGCMLTLDPSRTKGGDRAQLAPGCRDQGIVIFDPSAWQIVKGELVLTARAGHKAHLLKSGEGAWQKDPKDGGKPLGLKKL